MPATVADTGSSRRPGGARISWGMTLVAAGVVAVLSAVAWQQMRPGDAPPSSAEIVSIPVPFAAPREEPAAAPHLAAPREEPAAAQPQTETKAPPHPHRASRATPRRAAKSRVDVEDAKRAMLAEPDEAGVVAVTILTQPEGAIIYERNRRLGTSGLQLQMEAGSRRTLLALRNYHQPTQFVVDGTQQVVTVTLPPVSRSAIGPKSAPGSVTSSPGGAPVAPPAAATTPQQPLSSPVEAKGPTSKAPSLPDEGLPTSLSQ